MYCNQREYAAGADYGGAYMQMPVDNSEAVRLCMQLEPSYNQARHIRPCSAPMKRYSMDPRPPTHYDSRSKRPYTPFAARSTTGYSGAGAFLPKSGTLPRYNSLEDPHLVDYYERKFSAVSPRAAMMRYHSAMDLDRGLRGGRPSYGPRRRKEIVYKVAVTTADVKGAGTDAPAFICIRGLFGQLHRTRLVKRSAKSQKKVPFKFSTGSTHVFRLKSLDLGDLQSVIIEHTGIEERDSWLLQSVEIVNQASKKSWLFMCNHWLSLYKEDNQISRELFGIKSTRTRYEIVSVTGDIAEGGTNSRVFVTVFGRTGITHKIELKKEPPKVCFKQGQSDKFIVKAPCVGPITKVRIQHDNSGTSPSWFLERLVVSDLKHPKWKFYFNCGQWLSKTREDGAIIRELRGSRDPLGIPMHTHYKVSVYTGNKAGSGTDAGVFIQLFGENGNGREEKLRGNFKRGGMDEVVLESRQLGPLTKLRIGHDNKGFAAGWYLEKVIVDDLVLNRVYEFPVHRWFAEDEDDGCIVRDIPCKSSSKKAISADKGTTYELTVATGDLKMASTSARVYAILFSGKGKHEVESGRIFLENGLFDRGRVDIFKIDVPGIKSPISKLAIGHDNSGKGPGWYLTSVIVNSPSSGVQQTFPCNNWLAVDEGDCKIERILMEDLGLRKTRAIKIPWEVKVTTSDVIYAGTDAVVSMVLYGEKGKTDDLVLPNTKNSFERGVEDEFKVELEDVGLPYKLRIGHNNAGAAAGWHLDRVVMQNLATQEEYLFRCNRWMSRDEDDHDICRELPAVGPGILEKAPVCHYRIHVHTGKRKFAGTDANVFINVFGEKGDTGDRFLTHSATNVNKFEKGKVDEFVMEAVKLGKITKVKIGHDGANPGSGWYLDKVTVTEVEDSANKAEFECHRWFDTQEDDGLIVRELKGSTMLDKITYEVFTKTGKVWGAGTDANVFIKVFGARGDTGILQLKTSDAAINKFESGRTDTFKIEAEDIGEITKIRISHDGAGPGAGWYLDEVAILVPHQGKRYVFAAHRWLDEKEGDGKLEVDLDPTEILKVEKTIPYEITVYTGEIAGAGTDASVFIQIYGRDRKKSEKHNLRTRSDNFEQGYVDKFKINALDVGPIEKIRVGHDGTGFGAGWFLDKILIQRHATKGSKKLKEPGTSARRKFSAMADREGAMLAKRQGSQLDAKDDEIEVVTGNEEIEDYWFMSNRWFARDEDDGAIVREMLPTTEDGRKLSRLDEIEYTVAVKTGDVMFAGTDANVFITLFGEDSDCGERQLKTSLTNATNKFERNCEDVFKFQAVELGALTKVKIQHDNKGGGADWYLDYILVTDPKLGKEFFFPCQNWLSTSKDDGKISRELLPVDKKLMGKLKGKDKLKEELMLEQKDASTTYHVKVLTGDKFGAGTDANVNIILFGETNDTGDIPLKKSKTYENKFERGNMDEFDVEAVEIGELKKIRIGHDNFGGGADWYLDRVEIDCPKLGRKWYFPCNEWIGTGKGDGKLTRDIYPKEGATEEFIPCIPYEITTYTSDVSGASTNAGVYIQVYGSEFCTQQKQLCPKKERSGKFKKGKKSKFVVEMEDVGDPIEKIRIGHDGTGIGAGWHLDKVEVRRLKVDKKGSLIYEFPCRRWLARDEDDCAIERELVASKVVEESSRGGGEVQRRESSVKGALKQKKYKVNVYTGDVSSAGTNANVFCAIFGDKGDTGERKLVKSETYNDKFERGHCDIFTWEACDLGNIIKIKIRHDDAGLMSSWFLDKVEVVDLSANETSTFHCERWLSSSKDDKKLDRTIYVKGYEGDQTSSGGTLRSASFGSMSASMASTQSGYGRSPRANRANMMLGQQGEGPMVPYTVKVTTGPEKDMGTSGPIWIDIYGTKKRQTGRQLLELLQKSAFLPASVETFSFEAADVGEVKSIELGNEGMSRDAGWYLVSLKVEMPTKGKRYHFTCNSWLAKDKPDSKMIRTFLVNDGDNASTKSFKPMVTYEVTVHTGDREGAGTDSEVYLKLFGANGSTPDYYLEKGGERFERARRDFFKLEMEDVGTLKKIRIGHNGKGDRPHWHLDRIEMVNAATLELYHFKCGEWISAKKGDLKQLFADLPAILSGNEQLSHTEYKIIVKTSDVRGAGTDANVYVRLFGENGDSGDLHLKKSETNKSPFETNQTDEFIFKKILQLGPLARCRIWHDNKGLGAAWHLDNIVVQDQHTKRKWTFPCNKWLSLKDEDKQISRDLVCDAPPGEAEEMKTGLTTYEIEVVTSDKQDAGMVHNAWLILEGADRASKIFLMKNSQQDRILRKGQMDNFKMRAQHLGELRRLYLGAVERDDKPLGNVTGRDGKWHCHAINIRDTRSGTRYEFEVKTWLTIYPQVSNKNAEEIIVSKVIEDEAKAFVKKMRQRNVVKYEVVVHTGDLMGSGTNANVFITMYGENVDSGKLALVQAGRDLFERKQVDRFQLESVELGEIDKIRVEHDDSGFRSNWYLDRVEINNLSTGSSWNFPCSQWLSTNKGDNKLWKVLHHD